jgi:excisionase family DNA binding protein
MKTQRLRGAALPSGRDSDASPLEPEVVSVDEVCRRTNLGRSKVYQLIGDGTLPSLKVGKRRLVRLSTMRRVLEGLEQTGHEPVGGRQLRRAAR